MAEPGWRDLVAQKLELGDCVAGMRRLASNSINAVMTDPPYGVNIGGKKWDAFRKLDDYQHQTEEWAREAFRVVEPHGRMLVFGMPRTYHRMAMGIEKAGWVVRDQVAWLYGNGSGINSRKNGLLRRGFDPILVASKQQGTRLYVESATLVAPGQPERMPPNVAMDDEVAAELDAIVGSRTSGSRAAGVRSSIGLRGGSKGDNSPPITGSSGGPSRYFFRYAPLVHMSSDRPKHVVVKPPELLEWLVRLVVKPGDVILDPFMGTGTTALAAIRYGCDWRGFEIDPEVRADAIEAIVRELDHPSQGVLFT